MKRTLLTICLTTITLFTYAQENLIKDGKFETTSFSVSDVHKKFPGKGIWFPYLTSDKLAVLSVIKDDQKGNVASIQTLSNASYAYSFIGQRVMGEAPSGIYTLSFYAKPTTENVTNVSVYLKISSTPQKFFLINNYDAEKQSNSSGALRQLVLKKDWALYTVEFDLSNTVSTVSSPKNAGSAHVITKSTATDRNDFDVAISSTSKNAGLLFTDVTFKKKN
jgi:hypothetical protein